jgi:hypothetical protein
MKTGIPSLFLLAAIGFAIGEMTACKETPRPPTEQDAIAVWKNINGSPHYDDLLSLKETNGQTENVNGVQVYTFFYQARVRSAMKLGNRPAGTEETISSNYPFKWTEKGWLGPDNQVYPGR